ncbi:hypothetical protein GOBAR_AA24000 [Gossypium barbadense]|uniref:Uncharacterized protein n=1 Tax=Gossypium barbadense TaxID=3634 RepID=A0A2P5WZZ9_GOSBA|nr:hypothetical protein GOBAR_AA24000 [Gossypium barbadense]
MENYNPHLEIVHPHVFIDVAFRLEDRELTIESLDYPDAYFVKWFTHVCCRGLKQHNGELSGGAKASRAGRPWVCACVVRGFHDQSEACEFEFKWKMVSRKLPRKKKNKEADDCSLTLLQHRQTALNKVKGMLDCSHLEVEWQMSTS